MKKGVFHTLLKVVFGLCLVGYFAYWGASQLGPGIHPYAENYEFILQYEDVIEAVRQFKGRNNKYIVPPEIGLEDGEDQEIEKLYHFYFYYPAEDQIIYINIQSNKKSVTEISLIAVNQGQALGHWKDINKDFGWKKNREEIKKFEDRILNQLGLKK